MNPGMIPILHWPCCTIISPIRSQCGIPGNAYRSNDTRAVRSNQTGLVLGLQNVCDADHVYHPVSAMNEQNPAKSHTVLRNTLSDAAIVSQCQHTHTQTALSHSERQREYQLTRQPEELQPQQPPRYPWQQAVAYFFFKKKRKN